MTTKEALENIKTYLIKNWDSFLLSKEFKTVCKSIFNIEKMLAPDWILCSEKMPDDNKLVYVTDCNGMVYIRKFDGYCWWDEFEEYDFSKEYIIAWMTYVKPEPYGGENG